MLRKSLTQKSDRSKFCSRDLLDRRGLSGCQDRIALGHVSMFVFFGLST